MYYYNILFIIYYILYIYIYILYYFINRILNKNSQLSGSIPPEIGNLSQLEEL